MQDSRFSLYAVPSEEVTLDQLEEHLSQVLNAAKDEALTPDALERAKTRLIAETIYANDSQTALARIYGSALAIGESLEDVHRWPDDIAAVTRDDLAAVMEDVLVPHRSVTGFLRKAS
jgi:zinc protease